MEYWREGSSSTAISTTFASDVGQHNKIGGINFGTALVQSDFCLHRALCLQLSPPLPYTRAHTHTQVEHETIKVW